MRNALFAALALFVSAPALADVVAPRDLAVAPAPSAISYVALDAWFDRADATYARGEAVRLFARSNEDGYLTAFSIGAGGDVTQIYPNAFHPDNFLPAGATVEIPGPEARAVVTGAVGPERIELVLMRRSDPVCGPVELTGQRPFRRLAGGEFSLRRDLAIVAGREPRGWLATIEKRLWTIPAPLAAGSAWVGPTVVVAPGVFYTLPQD